MNRSLVGCTKCTLSLAACLMAGSLVYGAGAKTGPDPKLYQATVDRGVRFLAAQQAPDGSISSQVGIGPTALATLSLLRLGRGVEDPQVAKGLAYLLEFTQDTGGIHAPGRFFSNYATCVGLVCLKAANRDGRYDKQIRTAETFVRGNQWSEAKGRQPSEVSYGGAGYGGKSRPDLSNTAFFIETLRACGAGPDDPAVQRALVFVSRCQNLEGPHNTTPFAAKVNDGGFYYTCVLESQGGPRETPEGGLRSYGSMSYSGLKSMIFAGLTKDDPRVKAAIQWVRKYYDVKSNPGMGDAGLYYYYHTFAKALDVLGMDVIEDADGVKHDWRRDLTAELARRQQPDGSWVNAVTRWQEGDSGLATAFALLSLSYCRPGSGK